MSSSFIILCPSLVSDKKITRGFRMFMTADNDVSIISLVIIQYRKFLLLWFLLDNDGINSLCAKSNLASNLICPNLMPKYSTSPYNPLLEE